MEDLWKLQELGLGLGEIGERAEYERMVRRFRDEERRSNLRNLLYGDAQLPRAKAEPGSD